MGISGQIADAGTGGLFEADRCDPPERCAGPGELSEVFVPSGAIDPASDMSVSARVQNRSTSRPEHDCKKGPCDASLCPDGLCVSVVADPSWIDGEIETIACICGSERIVNVPLPSPSDEGVFGVEIWVEVDGEATERVSRTVTYREGASNACGVSTDCGAEERCIGGACRSTRREAPTTVIFGVLLTAILLIDLAERFL